MKKQHHIIIAGAGGIGEAAGILLAEWSETPPILYIGDRDFQRAQQVAQWIEAGATRPCQVSAFHMPDEGLTPAIITILQDAEILLDCLPGALAPKMAQYAKDYTLHYANLTEYVNESRQIEAIAADAATGFVLQTGLAPGYINVLAHGLYQQFCRDYQVSEVDTLEMKVGALTDHAVAPHFYGFTWSPVGVATEYLKDAVVVREHQKTTRPSLSETNSIIINGILYEDDLTSGGAADLPDALAGKVRNLDYKTLRHPGHYNWVRQELARIPVGEAKIAGLQQRMQAQIPHVEDDRIVLYAAVEGRDAGGVLRRREVARTIVPALVGKCRLRAIQITTAAPLIQSAILLLQTNQTGILHQSDLNPVAFLNGIFIRKAYGPSPFEAHGEEKN
ncbi:MAG: saccharopine dehydrogenase [Lewinellaceae bacterium]|nr:saccharopine dehydrogenase [Lewinellaceae bacterium]